MLLALGVLLFDATTGVSAADPSSSGWSQQASNISTGLLGVSCSSLAFCVAVGGPPDAGSAPFILTSRDEGTTWTVRDSGAAPAKAGDPFILSDVSCPAGGLCVAVGGDYLFTQELIERSTDGGVTWSRATVNSRVYLLGVSCPTTSFCAATGYDPFNGTTIVTSADGGNSWTDRTPIVASQSGAGLQDVSCQTATDCVVVGASHGEGAVYVTHDGGGSWSGFLLLRDAAFHGVTCPSRAVCYAVGNGGVIWSTKNGGSTWNLFVRPDQNVLDQIACFDVDHCVVSAYRGQILRTNDGGTSWSAESSGVTHNLLGVTCISAECWVVGDYGVILFNPGPPPEPPGSPTQVHAIAGDSEATVTWTPPIQDPRAPITDYMVSASPDGASATVDTKVPAATVTGLSNGTAYSFTVTAVNRIGAGAASAASNPVDPAAVPAGSPIAVLPAMSNAGYGGYLTAAYVENLGSSPAPVHVEYADVTGTAVGKGNSVSQLPPGGTWTLRQDNLDGLGSGQPGSAIVYSDQPLAIFVNEFAPGGRSDASSYTAIKVPTGTASKLFAPAIASAAYDGYTTGIGLLNTGTATTDVKITYRGQDGSLVKSQTLPGVAPGAYQGVYSGDSSSATDAKLPSGFAGTAVIESTSTPAQPLAAVVNEVGPGGQFSSTDAVAAGQLQLQAPVALNNAYGGFNTGMGIQETSGHSGTVTVTYYDDGGAAIPRTFAIAANGYLPVYQGDPVKGPPAGHYTATISSGVPVAAIVNEVAAAAGDARQSTGYNTFAGGTVAANLPLVESDGADGWSTGLGIMNSGASTTMVTVTYFDASTGAPVGASQSKMLQPHAFWGLYQPDGGLPAGTRASAEVRASSGGTVALICNESSPSSFMSYGGQ